MNIDEKIRECIESNGITINADGTLGEYDSIMFVSTIVSLEEEFDIEIPDEYLLYDFFTSLEGIEKMIDEIKGIKDRQ